MKIISVLISLVFTVMHCITQQ